MNSPIPRKAWLDLIRADKVALVKRLGIPEAARLLGMVAVAVVLPDPIEVALDRVRRECREQAGA